MTNKETTEIAVRSKEAIRKDEGEPTRAGVTYSPAVDIYETEEAITLLADFPGVTKEKLDIHLEERQLTITGLVEEPQLGPSVFAEYGIGGFTRSFKLGDTIDREHITASLKEGVLSLTLPKADRLRPRKIDIKTA